MKKILLLPVTPIVLLCCTNTKKEAAAVKDTKIAFRAAASNRTDSIPYTPYAIDVRN